MRIFNYIQSTISAFQAHKLVCDSLHLIRLLLFCFRSKLPSKQRIWVVTAAASTFDFINIDFFSSFTQRWALVYESLARCNVHCILCAAICVIAVHMCMLMLVFMFQSQKGRLCTVGVYAPAPITIWYSWKRTVTFNVTTFFGMNHSEWTLNIPFEVSLELSEFMLGTAQIKQQHENVVFPLFTFGMCCCDSKRLKYSEALIGSN